MKRGEELTELRRWRAILREPQLGLDLGLGADHKPELGLKSV